MYKFKFIVYAELIRGGHEPAPPPLSTPCLMGGRNYPPAAMAMAYGIGLGRAW